jgi:hypothetical protein
LCRRGRKAPSPLASYDACCGGYFFATHRNP